MMVVQGWWEAMLRGSGEARGEAAPWPSKRSSGHRTRAGSATLLSARRSTGHSTRRPAGGEAQYLYNNNNNNNNPSLLR